MILTDALIPGMKELGEGGGGSFVLDEGGPFLVGSQLAENSRRDALNVLDLIVQKLKKDERASLLLESSPGEV